MPRGRFARGRVFTAADGKYPARIAFDTVAPLITRRRRRRRRRLPSKNVVKHIIPSPSRTPDRPA